MNGMPQAMGLGNLAAAMREHQRGKAGISGRFKYKGRNKRAKGRIGPINPFRRKRNQAEDSEPEE